MLEIDLLASFRVGSSPFLPVAKSNQVVDDEINDQIIKMAKNPQNHKSIFEKQYFSLQVNQIGVSSF